MIMIIIISTVVQQQSVIVVLAVVVVVVVVVVGLMISICLEICACHLQVMNQNKIVEPHNGLLGHMKILCSKDSRQ